MKITDILIIVTDNNFKEIKNKIKSEPIQFFGSYHNFFSITKKIKWILDYQTSETCLNEKNYKGAKLNLDFNYYHKLENVTKSTTNGLKEIENSRTKSSDR